MFFLSISLLVDETLSEVIAVLETNDYNSNIENIVEEVYTAVNM
jgi:hypothetical protein